MPRAKAQYDVPVNARIDRETSDMIERASGALGGISRSAAIRVIVRTVMTESPDKIFQLVQVLRGGRPTM